MTTRTERTTTIQPSGGSVCFRIVGRASVVLRLGLASGDWPFLRPSVLTEDANRDGCWYNRLPSGRRAGHVNR